MTTGSHTPPTPATPGTHVQPEWAPGDPVERIEQALIDHALAGTPLDLVGDGRVDQETMSKWGPERTVRAAVLRHLLVESQWPVHSKGVRLRGVRISGRLDLESATLRCPLLLEDCYLDSPEPVALDYATAPRIVLSRCMVMGGLTGDFLVITKELQLKASVFEGVVRLAGAAINGSLSCTGAQLTGTDGDSNALFANRMKVGGGLFLDQGFRAGGVIRLLGVDITGQLSCRGARLMGTDRGGNAFVGNRMKVGGDVLFDQGFSAGGAVRLAGADITGSLACRGAQLTGTDRASNALVGDGMRVGGDMILDQGFTAAGVVQLAGADITGQLDCRGAQLTGTDRASNALVGDGMKVGGQFHWAPGSPVRGLVDLERAAVHRLDDDWSLLDDKDVPDAHWPPAGQLRLAGFTYDGFGGEHQASWRQRLDWIRRSHTTATDTTPAAFAAQPYEQLARVYREAGQEREARQVAIARRNDLRRYGNLTRPRNLGNWLLDKTIRHGYQPLRAVGLLVAVYVAVLLVFWGAQHQDSVIVPAKDTKNLTTVPTASRCSPAYPCFYPAGYAVDVVVPIINLRQAENWRPNGHADWGWAYIAVAWVATGLGWAFTTLAVAGYTGLVRKD
jgi:hypothetical protein